MNDDQGLTISQPDDLPSRYIRFLERFPELGAQHQAMGEALQAGPLDRKTCELIQIGICMGAGLESATKSHVRRALQAGASKPEIEHAIVQGMNTCGFPRVNATWTWALEQMEQENAR